MDSAYKKNPPARKKPEMKSFANDERTNQRTNETQTRTGVNEIK